MNVEFAGMCIAKGNDGKYHHQEGINTNCYSLQIIAGTRSACHVQVKAAYAHNESRQNEYPSVPSMEAWDSIADLGDQLQGSTERYDGGKQKVGTE
jgi:hypothetical protein